MDSVRLDQVRHSFYSKYQLQHCMTSKLLNGIVECPYSSIFKVRLSQVRLELGLWPAMVRGQIRLGQAQLIFKVLIVAFYDFKAIELNCRMSIFFNLQNRLVMVIKCDHNRRVIVTTKSCRDSFFIHEYLKSKICIKYSKHERSSFSYVMSFIF